jgi:hypothetical protein
MALTIFSHSVLHFFVLFAFFVSFGILSGHSGYGIGDGRITCPPFFYWTGFPFQSRLPEWAYPS